MWVFTLAAFWTICYAIPGQVCELISTSKEHQLNERSEHHPEATHCLHLCTSSDIQPAQCLPTNTANHCQSINRPLTMVSLTTKQQ